MVAADTSRQALSHEGYHEEKILRNESGINREEEDERITRKPGG
jgi:hypothetical protein